MHRSITQRPSGRTICFGALVLISAALFVPVMAQDQNAPPPPTPAAEPQASAENTSEVIPLGEVDVRGKRSLFDEQAARRKKLLDGSAPCLGCDAKPIEHHRKLLERVADYALDQVTPQAAPEKDEAGNLDHQRQVEEAHPTNSNP